MQYIRIGQIVKPFGIKGELKVYPYTDFPLERFAKNKTVYLLIDGQYLPYKIDSSFEHKGLMNVRFQGYNDINQVEKYRGIDVFYDLDAIKDLAKGEYYIFQIKGLDVYDNNNQHLGQVIEVEPTPRHNNLRIKKADGTTFLVPNISNFVKEVDLENKKIIVELIEGMG